MTGFEPRIGGVRNNRSTNCATTTALYCLPHFAFKLFFIFVTDTVTLNKCTHLMKSFWWQKQMTNFRKSLPSLKRFLAHYDEAK